MIKPHSHQSRYAGCLGIVVLFAAAPAASDPDEPAAKPIGAPLDTAALNPLYDAFLKRTYEEQWAPHYRVKSRRPWEKDLGKADWAAIADDETDVEGAYTFNPGRLTDADFERLSKQGKVEAITLENFKYQRFAKVAEYAYTTLAKDYYIPGIEFLKWMADHPDKAPAVVLTKVKSARQYLAFGSILGLPQKDQMGDWAVASVNFVDKCTKPTSSNCYVGMHFGVHPLHDNIVRDDLRVLVIRKK